MSLIITAAELVWKAEVGKVEAAQRARLQAAFTDSAGKVLVDVSKLTVAKTDAAEGLLIVTDGTVYVAVTRGGFRLVTPDGAGEGGFTDGPAFTSLLELAALLAAR